MELEQDSFPWMTPYDVGQRRRWKEDYNYEQHTIDDIIEEVPKDREQLDMISQHHLIDRSPLHDS